jgi:hypothetical protein
MQDSAKLNSYIPCSPNARLLGASSKPHAAVPSLETVPRPRVNTEVEGSEEEPLDPPQNHHDSNYDPRQLKHGDAVPSRGHARQARRAVGQARAERGEVFGLRAVKTSARCGDSPGPLSGEWRGPHVAVDQVVVARVVVYVDGDVAQLRDLGAQGVQQGVVLPLALVGFGGHGFGGVAGREDAFGGPGEEGGARAGEGR